MIKSDDNDDILASATDDDFGGSSAGDDDGGEQTLVTKAGLKRLKEELDLLKNVKRKEVSQRLKEAISYGDLSENSEYEEAKNEQAFLEGRILELDRKIKNAKIISEKDGRKEVNIGSTVTLKSVKDKDEEEQTFTIVGATEADPFAKRISNESPVGKAVLNCVKGEVITVQTPSGIAQYEISKVA